MRRTFALSICVVALTALVAIRKISIELNLTVAQSASASDNCSLRTTSHAIRGTSPEEVRSQLEAMCLTPIYDPVITTDPWKAELFQRLDRIRVACGELCQMNTVEAVQEHTVPVPGSVIPMVQVESVDCHAILGLEEIDAGDTTAPPIPDELRPYYTFNNALEITKHKPRKDIYLGGASATSLWKTGNVWKEDDINQAVHEAAAGTLKGRYGVKPTVLFRDTVGQLPLRGKSVLVIGSSHPWVEVILLHHGATKVTTLEYGELISEHPQIRALTPSQFRQQYLAGTLETFDGVVSHSSIEHSGLGRYGDALNPWGDILAVARAWCVTKDNGFMYLGLPTGNDNIMSNWHRNDGVIRWPLVAANWTPLPSTSDGTELTRDIQSAMKNGGFGYLFTKTS